MAMAATNVCKHPTCMAKTFHKSVYCIVHRGAEFINHKSVEYFGISCTETSEPNWWNRQYLVSKALQQMALESQ